MQNNEVWKDIPGFEGYYQVSNIGNVKRLGRHSIDVNGVRKYYKEKILKKSSNSAGYLTVTLMQLKSEKSMYVHRLVALAWIKNSNDFKYVNHKDGNKVNNNVSNLEWCTCKHNINHSFKLGLSKSRKGEKSNFSVLTAKQVKEIRRLHREQRLSYRTISYHFPVSEEAVSLIVRRKTWKHI